MRKGLKNCILLIAVLCVIVCTCDSDKWKVAQEMVDSYQQQTARMEIFLIFTNNKKIGTQMYVNETGYDDWELKATSKGKLQTGSPTKVAQYAQIYKASLCDMFLLSTLIHFKYYGNIFWTLVFLSWKLLWSSHTCIDSCGVTLVISCIFEIRIYFLEDSLRYQIA